MFKQNAFFMLLALLLTKAVHAAPYSELNCFNHDTSFNIIFDKNPRNNADASFQDIKGPFPVDGVWLWHESDLIGRLTAKSIYKTMDGGKLTLIKNIAIGRGGCGRGSCDWDYNHAGKISAYLVNGKGNESIYDCSEI